MKEKEYIIGIGCRRGVTSSNIESALFKLLNEKNIKLESVSELASIDLKSNEEGLLAFAKKWHLNILFFSKDQLNSIDVPTPSQMVQNKIGTPSVCEAAAILAGKKGKKNKSTLIVEKQKYGNITIAILKKGNNMKIYAVGIGPGARDLLTPRAKKRLKSSDTIIGHAPYISQIKDLIGDKTIISSGMRREIERCEEAIKRALKGERVSVISSGDAGIYGMGGLLLELVNEKKLEIDIEILPGITAANGAASVLGAPLMNDFAVISLSDLLTPQEVIRKRITKIAESDLLCVLYNPSSKKRTQLIKEVISEFCEVRTKEIICGIVKNATRENEEKWIGKISEFPFGMLDMSSVVLIGNSQTIIQNEKMITRRGYRLK